MPDMLFDAFLSLGQSMGQVGLFYAGILMAGLGGIMVFKVTQSNLSYIKVQGTIVGVRQKGNIYYPVYSYILPDGRSFETTSSSGSSLTSNKNTGRTVTLYVSPDNPEDVSESDWVIAIIGLVFLLPGIGMLYSAFQMGTPTATSGIIFLAIIIYFAFKIKKLIIPKEQRAPNALAWREKRKAERKEKMEALPFAPIEEMLDSPEMQKKQKEAQQGLRYAAPLMLIIAAALLYFGGQIATETHELETKGLRANGVVVRLETVRSSDSTTYKPVVRFVDHENKEHTFKTSYSSDPPAYKAGESVKVMYLENSPQASADIDGGWKNWIFPCLLLGFGALSLLLSLSLFRKASAAEVR